MSIIDGFKSILKLKKETQKKSEELGTSLKKIKNQIEDDKRIWTRRFCKEMEYNKLTETDKKRIKVSKINSNWDLGDVNIGDGCWWRIFVGENFGM